MHRQLFRRLANLWQWRELFLVMVGSDLRLRYKGSALGILWSLMHPLALAAVYVVALSYIIRVRMENYGMFLLSGVLPWVFFSSSLNQAAGAIAQQGNLVKKVAFPREVLPFVTTFSQFIHFAIAYLVVVPLFAYYQVGIGATFLLVPLVMVCFVVFTAGLALAVATAQVYFRDTQHLLSVVLQLLFWLTPILYSLKMVPERFRPFALANPLAIYLSTYQEIIVEQVFPGWPQLAMVVGLALLSLVVGYAIFLKGERRIAEFV